MLHYITGIPLFYVHGNVLHDWESISLLDFYYIVTRILLHYIKRALLH